MTTRLIVNADDYGRTVEVSRGIRQAHLTGIVTSTTAMMNMPNIEDDLKLALRETPRLGLGVHLVLTAGQPLTPPRVGSTLSSEKGEFLKLAPFTAQCSQLDPLEVKDELTAQIEKFTRLTGRTPSHLDSHHHASYFTVDLFRTMLELAQEYGCAIRIATVQHSSLQPASGPGNLDGMPPELHELIHDFAPRLLQEYRPLTPVAFIPTFYDETATKLELLKIIEGLPEGNYEMMCHPGYVDEELLRLTSYARQRVIELSVLTDPEVKSAIQRQGIELITFKELSK